MERVTLDSIIKNYINEKGASSKHGYMRYLQILINGMKEMNYDVSGRATFQECIVSDQCTIPMPLNMISMIGVYGLTEQGQWFAYAKSSKQSMSVKEACGVQVKSVGDTELINQSYLTAFGYNSVESYANHNRNGENTGGYYNQPGGNPYTFRENHQMGTIELSSNTSYKVILEYLPSAVQINGEFMVHPFLLEPLLAWLRYATMRSKRNVSQQEIQMLKRDYNNFKRLAKLRFNSFSAADFKNAFRSAYLATYKF